MRADYDFSGVFADKPAESEVRKRLYVRVVAFIKCIIKVEHDLPVVRSETHLNIHHGDFRVFDRASGGFAAFNRPVMAAD